MDAHGKEQWKDGGSARKGASAVYRCAVLRLIASTVSCCFEICATTWRHQRRVAVSVRCGTATEATGEGERQRRQREQGGESSRERREEEREGATPAEGFTEPSGKAAIFGAVGKRKSQA